MIEVILLERVPSLGAIGAVVKVRPGYARNYLLPQRKALRATEANRKVFEAQRAELEARNARLRDDARSHAEKLDGQVFTLIRQSGESGQLYGSVSARDISEAAAVGGFTIDRKHVELQAPIKTLGLHKVLVRLHPEVDVTVSVNVARTAEEAERQVKGEDVVAAAMAAERAEIEAQAAELAAIAAETAALNRPASE